MTLIFPGPSLPFGMFMNDPLGAKELLIWKKTTIKVLSFLGKYSPLNSFNFLFQKETKMLQDPNKQKLRTKTFLNALAANTFIVPWSKFVLIWPHTKNARVQPGFVTSVPKHLELKDHYEFVEHLFYAI